MNKPFFIMAVGIAACLFGCRDSHVARQAVEPRKPSIVKFDIPTEKEGSTYCTIVQNGSYDIHLTGPDGHDLVVLGRICGTYQETRYNADGPRHPSRHVLDTTWSYTVQSSNVTAISSTSFQTEFFSQGVTPPQRSWLSNEDGIGGWACTSSQITRTATVEDELYPPTGPSILPNAAGDGIVHIVLRYYPRC